MGLFSRKKTRSTDTTPKHVAIQPLNYPPKVILAWNECLKGNVEITNWLLENGYRELVIATSVIHQEETGEKWLMQNGFPHLLAFAHAMDDDEEALKWLEVNKFEKLRRIALAAQYENWAWDWVLGNCTEDLILLTKTLRLLLKQSGR